MKFLVGLVVGAILAAAIGAAAFSRIDDGHFSINLGDDDGEERIDEETVSKSFDFEDFDRIDIAGVYELDVTVGGDAYSIELSGPESEMDRIEAGVEDGELTLGQRKRTRGEKRFKREGVEAVITLPALRELEISGVVDGTVKGIAAEKFTIDLSGVGDMTLEGTCDELDADVSGVGDLDAEDLICRVVDVDVSGVGDASVHATESVNADITGMGSIDIYGSPTDVKKDGGMFSSITVH